jgi:hypothetical protein
MRRPRASFYPWLLTLTSLLLYYHKFRYRKFFLEIWRKSVGFVKNGLARDTVNLTASMKFFPYISYLYTHFTVLYAEYPKEILNEM